MTHEIKGTQIRSKEMKVSLFVDDRIVIKKSQRIYQNKQTNNNKKLLESINELSKVTGYKINIQKLIIFKYIRNEGYGDLN